MLGHVQVSGDDVSLMEEIHSERGNCNRYMTYKLGHVQVSDEDVS